MEKAARWCQACFEMRLIVFATPLLLASVSLSGAETQAIHVATPDADGVQRIRVVGGDYFFKPARIVVERSKWFLRRKGPAPGSDQAGRAMKEPTR